MNTRSNSFIPFIMVDLIEIKTTLLKQNATNDYKEENNLKQTLLKVRNKNN